MTDEPLLTDLQCLLHPSDFSGIDSSMWASTGAWLSFLTYTPIFTDFLHGTNVTLNQQGRWQMAFSHLTVEFYSNTNSQLGLRYENKLKNVPCPIYSSTDLQESMKSLTSKYFLIFITFSGFLSGMNSDAVQGPDYDWRHYHIQYVCNFCSLSHILNDAWTWLNVSPSSLHS